MKKVLMLVLTLSLTALYACSGNTAPTRSSGTVGVAVQVDGGSFINVSAQELKALLEHKDFVFVNTHIPYEGELEQTDAFVPYDALDENLGKLPADKNAKIILYCRSGNMSTSAAHDLVKKGYTNVYNLEGGWHAWQAAGYPLLRK